MGRMAPHDDPLLRVPGRRRIGYRLACGALGGAAMITLTDLIIVADYLILALFLMAIPAGGITCRSAMASGRCLSCAYRTLRSQT